MAVDRLVLRQLATGQVDKRRIEVVADRRFVAHRARTSHRRILDDQRHPHSTLEQRPLFASQRGLGGDDVVGSRAVVVPLVEAAIVGCEHDHRLAGQPLGIDGIDDPSHHVVGVLDHRRVDRVRQLAIHRRGLATVLLGLGRHRSQRNVDRVGREHQEKRLLSRTTPVGSLDEVDAEVGLEICSILPDLRLQIGTALHPVTARQMRTVDHGSEVVALRAGLITSPGTKVPLADISGRVTGLPQRLGHRHRRQGQRHRRPGRDHPLEGPPVTGNEIGDADPGLVLAGLQCTASRRADGPRGVEIREPQSTGCQGINPGRIDKIVAVATNVLPAQVVDKDQDNVGPIGRLDNHGRGQDDDRQDKSLGPGMTNLSGHGGVPWRRHVLLGYAVDMRSGANQQAPLGNRWSGQAQFAQRVGSFDTELPVGGDDVGRPPFIQAKDLAVVSPW